MQGEAQSLNGTPGGEGRHAFCNYETELLELGGAAGVSRDDLAPIIHGWKKEDLASSRRPFTRSKREPEDLPGRKKQQWEWPLNDNDDDGTGRGATTWRTQRTTLAENAGPWIRCLENKTTANRLAMGEVKAFVIRVKGGPEIEKSGASDPPIP